MSNDGKKFLIVHGQRGLGKKCVTIQAVKYCIDRNSFRDGAYCIDVGVNNSIHSFLSHLYKKLKLVDISNLTDFCDYVRSSEICLIFNDI